MKRILLALVGTTCLFSTMVGTALAGDKVVTKNGNQLECSISEIANRFKQPDVPEYLMTKTATGTWVTLSNGFEAGLSAGAFLVTANWFGNSQFPYSEKEIALNSRIHEEASYHSYQFIHKLMQVCFSDNAFSDDQKKQLEFFFDATQGRVEFHAGKLDVSYLRQVGFDQSILDQVGGKYYGGAMFIFK